MDVEELIANAQVVERIREWYGQEHVNVLYLWRALEARQSYEDIVSNFGPSGAYAVDWSRLGLDQEIADLQWYVEDPNDPSFYVEGDLSRTSVTADSPEKYLQQRVNIASGAWSRIYPVVGAEASASIDVYATFVDAGWAANRASAETVDWAAVQEMNKVTLKGLEEGESVPFWQAGYFLVLGDTGDAQARMAIEQQLGLEPTGGSPGGTVTMVEKGGMMSPGSIRVQGSYSAAEFEQAIRDFSKKEIDFA